MKQAYPVVWCTHGFDCLEGEHRLLKQAISFFRRPARCFGFRWNMGDEQNATAANRNPRIKTDPMKYIFNPNLQWVFL